MTRFKIASRMTFAVLATAVLSLSAYAQPRRGPGPEVLATVNGAATPWVTAPAPRTV